MSEQETENTEETLEQIEPQKSKKKIYIIIAIAILLLALAVGGFLFLNSKKESTDEQQKEKLEDEAGAIQKKEGIKNPVEEAFVDLEEFIVNLQERDGHPSFLKVTITLHLPNKNLGPVIQAKMPLIQDAFQTYLRELKAEDLQGSSGIYLLREELILRVNKVIAPDKITDILFKEFLVQ